MQKSGSWFAIFAAATTIFVGAVAEADRPSKPVKPMTPPAPVAAGAVGLDRPAAARQALSSIDDRVHDIETLRQAASRDGQATRLSCIDDKLRKAKTARTEAAQLVGEANVQTAFDQILLRQVYAIVYAEEARACADLKPVGPAGPVQGDKPGNNTPEIPNPVTDVPVVVRPPLASTY